MKLINFERRPYLNLFVITFFLCLLINSGSLDSIDALNRLQVTHWIWTHAPQVLGNTANTVTLISAIGRGGHSYVTWGIGESLIMLPGDVIATTLIHLAHLQRLSSLLDPGFVSYFTFPFINALSICLACSVLRGLSFSLRDSVLGAFTLLFCTTFLLYAQVQQENGLMLLCILAGFSGNLLWFRTGKLHYLALGVFALGYGLLIRLPSIFDAFTIFLFICINLLVQMRRQNHSLGSYGKKISVYTGFFAVFYAPFVVADRLYQWLRFQSFTTTYTSIWGKQMRAATPSLPPSFPFNAPFHEGFFGQLFSPGRSIFLFNPLLILTVILFVRLWKYLDIQLRVFFLPPHFYYWPISRSTRNGLNGGAPDPGGRVTRSFPQNIWRSSAFHCF